MNPIQHSLGRLYFTMETTRAYILLQQTKPNLDDCFDIFEYKNEGLPGIATLGPGGEPIGWPTQWLYFQSSPASRQP